MQGMHTLNSAFSSIHMKAAIPEIDLAPTQGTELGSTQSMSICQEDRRRIPSPIPSSFTGGLDQPINLLLSQILSHSVS
jgi:hypothetical protein